MSGGGHRRAVTMCCTWGRSIVTCSSHSNGRSGGSSALSKILASVTSTEHRFFSGLSSPPVSVDDNFQPSQMSSTHRSVLNGSLFLKTGRNDAFPVTRSHYGGYWRASSILYHQGIGNGTTVNPSRAFSIFPWRKEEKSGSEVEINADKIAQTDEFVDSDDSIGIAGPYTADSIVDIATQAESAALEAATEGAWLPTKALDWLLSSVHSYSGLPWWQSIMLTTFGIRLASMPVVLMQIKNTYKLSLARPEIESLLNNMKEEQAKGNPNAVRDYQQQVARVWAKHGANPIKSMATLFIQAPLFIGFFAALRGLAAAKVPSLVEGGTLWFSDLTSPDPTYALPILAGATFLLTVELGAADGMQGQTESAMKKMKNIMRGVAVLIVPFTVNLPASVFMYWTASNTFSLFQTLILKNKKMKKVLGLPDLSRLKDKTLGMPESGKPIVTFTQRPTVKKKKSRGN